ELVQRIAEAFDEPFGDEAALPTLLVCEATRRHVKVALVGDGGDEAFGGYERYRAHALAGRIPHFAAAAGAGALGRIPQASRARRAPAPAGCWTSRPRRPTIATHAWWRSSRSSSAAGSGRTRRSPRRRPTTSPSKVAPTTGTCASSTSSRTCPAICCPSPTSP